MTYFVNINQDQSADSEKDLNESEIKDDELIQVHVNELIGKFRSKGYIYEYLTTKKQLFLPPFGEAKIGKTFIMSLI